MLLFTYFFTCFIVCAIDILFVKIKKNKSSKIQPGPRTVTVRHLIKQLCLKTRFSPGVLPFTLLLISPALIYSASIYVKLIDAAQKAQKCMFHLGAWNKSLLLLLKPFFFFFLLQLNLKSGIFKMPKSNQIK